MRSASRAERELQRGRHRGDGPRHAGGPATLRRCRVFRIRRQAMQAGASSGGDRPQQTVRRWFAQSHFGEELEMGDEREIDKASRLAALREKTKDMSSEELSALVAVL